MDHASGQIVEVALDALELRLVVLEPQELEDLAVSHGPEGVGLELRVGGGGGGGSVVGLLVMWGGAVGVVVLVGRRWGECGGEGVRVGRGNGIGIGVEVHVAGVVGVVRMSMSMSAMWVLRAGGLIRVSRRHRLSFSLSLSLRWWGLRVVVRRPRPRHIEVRLFIAVSLRI